MKCCCFKQNHPGLQGRGEAVVCLSLTGKGDHSEKRFALLRCGCRDTPVCFNFSLSEAGRILFDLGLSIYTYVCGGGGIHTYNIYYATVYLLCSYVPTLLSQLNVNSVRVRSFALGSLIFSPSRACTHSSRSLLSSYC